MISLCSPLWYDQFLHSASLTPTFASWIASSCWLGTKLAAASQNIAVAKQVEAGLGRHISTLTASQVEDYQKVGFSDETSEENELSQLTVLNWADGICCTVALYTSTVSSKICCLALSFDYYHYQDMSHHSEGHSSCKLRLDFCRGNYHRFAVRFVSTVGHPIKSMLQSGQSERVRDQIFAENPSSLLSGISLEPLIFPSTLQS